MLDDYLDVLTIDDTAAVLRLSRRSVKRLLDEGEIEYRKIGRIYRISKKAILDYLYNKPDTNKQ
ncbi:MAG: helix-turn-helix domain-containing protein [Clostridiales bacterium]|nr:helix-turn-helix domain-containing protein [Clostridiales bacterium]